MSFRNANDSTFLCFYTRHFLFDSLNGSFPIWLPGKSLEDLKYFDLCKAALLTAKELDLEAHIILQYAKIDRKIRQYGNYSFHTMPKLNRSTVKRKIPYGTQSSCSGGDTTLSTVVVCKSLLLFVRFIVNLQYVKQVYDRYHVIVSSLTEASNKESNGEIDISALFEKELQWRHTEDVEDLIEETLVPSGTLISSVSREELIFKNRYVGLTMFLTKGCRWRVASPILFSTI